MSELETIEEPEEEPVEAEPETDEELAAAEEEAELEDASTPTEEQIAKAMADAEKRNADILDKLDREAQRHRNRLAEILEEDILSCVPCELCRADPAGWIDMSTPIPDEVKQRVRIQIGDREPENWQPDPDSQRCATCDGQGEVVSGSRKTGQTELVCLDCNGRGWVDRGEMRRRVGRPATVLAAPVQVAVSNGPAEVKPSGYSDEDLAEVERLRAKGIVVVVPQRG